MPTVWLENIKWIKTPHRIFGTVEKPLMNRGAPMWFHNLWTNNARVIEYWTNFHWKLNENSIFNFEWKLDFRLRLKKIYHFPFQTSFNWANNICHISHFLGPRCLLIILSAATIVHRVVFGVCSILDIHYVATSVHHVVFSLSMASTTPTLAFFCMLEFCWRWKVVGWLFWPKTLPFKYVHCFPWRALWTFDLYC